MNKPSFFAAIAALRLDVSSTFAHVHPSDSEADAADALEVVHAHHAVTAEDPDSDGSWGPCEGCHDPWPCKTWLWGQALAVQWLGRAADRVYAHARTIKPGGAA